MRVYSDQACLSYTPIVCDEDSFQEITLESPNDCLPAAGLHPEKSPDGAGLLQSNRFKGHPFFTLVLRGEQVIDAEAADAEVVETVQLTLYSLGYDLGESWVDGKFGKATRQALMHFQCEMRIPATGYVDALTLSVLDRQTTLQTTQLQALTPMRGEKSVAYRIVVDMWSDPQYLYVLDHRGDPAARYLTSSGMKGHETPLYRGRVTESDALPWWYPPKNREWAKKYSIEKPGLHNMLGLAKHRLRDTILIHGTQKQNEPLLGKPGSHGCLWLSPSNILEFSEFYIEAGSEYAVTNDENLSRDLDQKFKTAGLVTRDIEDGREYMAAYAAGEMGRDSRL